MIKYIRLIFFVVPRLIFAYFTWILPYYFRKDKVPFEKRFYKVQKLARYVLRKMHVVYYLNNYEEFFKNKEKDKNYIFFCNHIGSLDPILFLAINKTPTTFVAKKEARKIPFVGKIIYILDGEFLDRKDLKQEVKVFYNVQKKILNSKNMDFVIFPEGTRNKAPYSKKVQEFHPGTFRCAFKTQANIVFCSIFGTFRGLALKTNCANYPFSLTYIETLKYDDYVSLNTTQISLIAHEKIEKEVGNLVDFDYSITKFINKKVKRNVK